MTTYSLADQQPAPLPRPVRPEVKPAVDRDAFNGLVRLQMTPPETRVTTTYWLTDATARTIAEDLLKQVDAS